ncbi:MAG TPA: alpha/beta fold hydrolase [Solirubrobacterales bacterium]|nr:alpha/beta fold hydrolase [Solirubrobacterales bacterium]
MARGWKIAIGVVVALIVLVGVNAVVTGAETKSAAITEPGGRIVSLPGGDLEVVEEGRRDGSPIVLIHCFTCAINWWDEMIPTLARNHRVIAVDLLGHGGSEKPSSGYSIENQADLVAQVLGRLGVRDAEVVGHSLGGPVSIALAERSPQLVNRLVTIDSIPDTSYGDVGFIGELPFKPVLGETLWRIKPDFSIKDGLEVAFAPGFEVPNAFVEGVKRMTYSAYTGSHDAFDDYTGTEPLPQRAAATGKPTLAVMGAEEQIASDPRDALAAYRAAGAQTKLIQGAGHSPNVEKPAETAALVLAFGSVKKPANRVKASNAAQDRLQKSEAVRGRP